MALVGLMGRTQCTALDPHQTAKISVCGFPSDVICVRVLQLTGFLTEIMSTLNHTDGTTLPKPKINWIHCSVDKFSPVISRISLSHWFITAEINKQFRY